MTEPTQPEQGVEAVPTARNVQYKGAPLDSEKGPGLGCFWSQVVVLLVLLILTPLSVAWEWPTWLSAALLVLVLILLLFAGQTVIFLLRLVAADRRAAGRRRPLASSTPTVGEIEDHAATDPPPEPVPPLEPASPAPPAEDQAPGEAGGGVRE